MTVAAPDPTRTTAAAVPPRLRGVLHQAAFAVFLVTGTTLVVCSPAGPAQRAAWT